MNKYLALWCLGGWLYLFLSFIFHLEKKHGWRKLTGKGNKKKRRGQKWWLANVNRETRNVGDQQVIGKGYFVSPYTFADHLKRALFHFNETGFSSYWCVRLGGLSRITKTTQKLPIILYVLRVPRERPQFLSFTGICYVPRLLTRNPHSYSSRENNILFYSVLVCQLMKDFVK